MTNCSSEPQGCALHMPVYSRVKVAAFANEKRVRVDQRRLSLHPPTDVSYEALNGKKVTRIRNTEYFLMPSQGTARRSCAIIHLDDLEGC